MRGYELHHRLSLGACDAKCSCRETWVRPFRDSGLPLWDALAGALQDLVGQDLRAVFRVTVVQGTPVRSGEALLQSEPVGVADMRVPLVRRTQEL